MFLLDKEGNQIFEIKKKTFQECGFEERKHLQEWIAKKPSCLGEDLLIIQKEFDGFDDTNERLDLLALDKNGDFVVIENKLDDTGRDVVWQALKYVSYCSTLTKDQIKGIYQQYLDRYESGERAEERILEFLLDDSENGHFDEISLNANDQRMILIAAKFRKEVTSTALWMIDHGIRVQCFRAEPYELDNKIILDIEQIIPVKEAEEYIIKLADKEREEKATAVRAGKWKEIRKKFWGEFLPIFNQKGDSDLCRHISPTTDNFIYLGSGFGGVPFYISAAKSKASVGLYINKGTQEQNKKIFDRLYEQEQIIENNFGGSLVWDRSDNSKGSVIFYVLDDVDVTKTDDWEKMIAFFLDVLPRFEKAIKVPLREAVQK